MAIVGGGAAGFAAADAMRKLGWRGAISIFSEEKEDPYERTLLTKDSLGRLGDDRLPITRHSLTDLGVDLRVAQASNKSTPEISNCGSRTGRCEPDELFSPLAPLQNGWKYQAEICRM